ncbi:cellulase family glycosylhydrolase [Victivallaceae bacterium BBE-744-WT-12]|uniref:Cellulase family glycosylhydrolase n=1 Tax=Victivallis lenta TaxID=2606640 RepID=A0A844G146_9BACT|nr:cellulase family glycosylhydrolase [Victivallis lenta]AVM45928.1 hypothetical protein C5Q97_14915 [Victivallales bacterium CCUG 44730]MST96642.1 cellulase family glycosylhydrolase [Victivallis lenta]HBP07228.1 hypothetical protein [Lentisphaeria bacterium]HCH87148.1 hypothetical protein [Lentisphaeria bacterium]
MKHLSRTLTAAALAAAPALFAAGPAVITVDASKVVAPVNELGFGNNIEAADGRGIFSEPADAKTFNVNGVKYGQGFWDPDKNAPNPVTTGLAKTLRMGMMRYPGGCLAHNYNWTHAVGPLSERSDWKFGIDQFMELCRKMNWEPLFTLTDYALPAEELPQHLANLVEYLNAPATPEHPWAMKRAEWGHKEPYGVKYFELGNETDHGSHKTNPRRSYTPEQYIKYATDSIKAIRKVDPTVKLGLVTVPGNGTDWNCDWNRKVIAGAGALTDFLVIHFYGPGIGGQDADTALRRVLAYPDQLTLRMKQYRDLTKELAGKELPLAITEYNIGGSGNDPFPVRFTYLAGLMNADLMRLWQQPENKVEFANYWHILNGWWGAYRSNDADGKITERKATLPFFEVWGKYRGTEIVASSVAGNPRVTAAAGPGLMPSIGDVYSAGTKIGEQTSFKFNFTGFNRSDIVPRSTGRNSLEFTLNNAKGNCYTIFSRINRPKNLPNGESLAITLSFEMRFVPDKKGEVPQATMGLGLCDPRGWDKTMSAAAFTHASLSDQWTKVSKSFTTLSDADGSDMLLRFEEAKAPVSGKLEFRDIKAELGGGEKFPAYPAIATFATKSADGKSLYLLVFNKDPDNAVNAEIELKNFKTASGESIQLYQEKVEATDYFSGLAGTVTVKDGKFSATYPKHSLTAYEFKLQ